MMYKFNKKEIKSILDNLIICVDSREQSNQHIIDFFDKKKVPYVVEKLPFGDYSCKIKAGSFDGQVRDIYFTNDFVIERKANIDELANNLRKDAARLKKELAHLMDELEENKKAIQDIHNNLNKYLEDKDKLHKRSKINK